LASGMPFTFSYLFNIIEKNNTILMYCLFFFIDPEKTKISKKEQ